MQPKTIARALLAGLLLASLFTLPVDSAWAGIDRFTPFGPWNGTIVAYAVDPHTPTSLLAVTDFYGLYRSDDGGHTWAWSGAGLDRDPERVAADPANPGSFYLITSSAVFHSADGGRSWTRIAAGLSFTSPLFQAPGNIPNLTLLPGGRNSWRLCGR